MSAESVARWQSIPMSRPDPDEAHSLKRHRQDEDDDSEDNVSLVSRSPSPRPQPDAMDIDKYDEYHRGSEREVVTVDTKIKSSNKGFAMLAKLGWVEGQPLGLSGDGRVDPIPFLLKNDSTGLGKFSQDVRMIESTVSQRRELDSERQHKETEEQRRAREDLIAKRAAVQSEVSAVLRPFYCELCDKQFQNVAQYDEHTNSYAHHHKARFRDMQQAARGNVGGQEEVDKRKEKERKREEKELRKLAKAAGIKLAKPPTGPKTASTTLGADTNDTVPSTSEPDSDSMRRHGSDSGWASVAATSAGVGPSSSVQLPTSTSNPNISASGWTSLGSTNEIPPRVAQQVHSSTGSAAVPNTSAPTFRTGGWSSLETTTLSQPTPPPPNAQPPPSTSSSTGFSRGWSAVSSSAAPSSFTPPASAPFNPPQRQEATAPEASIPQASVTAASRQKVPKAPKAAERQESARSGWQQFRSGGPSRRR